MFKIKKNIEYSVNLKILLSDNVYKVALDAPFFRLIWESGTQPCILIYFFSSFPKPLQITLNCCFKAATPFQWPVCMLLSNLMNVRASVFMCVLVYV